MSFATLKQKNFARAKAERIRRAAAKQVVRQLFDGLRADQLASSRLPDAPVGLKWNKLFPFGTRYRSDFEGGSMTFDRGFFDAMVRNFEKIPQDLPVDYFHRGASDKSPVANDDKGAAGWIVDLAIIGTGTNGAEDGLWGLFKWNDKAKQKILSDELRYLSPTFTEAGVDRTTGLEQGPTLFGAGLLNDGFLNDLPKVTASAVPSLRTRSEQRISMDHATACKHFGLDPDQTSPEQLSQHMAKAGAAYQKAGGHQPPAGAGAGAEGEGGGEGGDVDPDGDGEPDGGPQGGGAGGAVHVHVHAEGAAVKKTKKNLSATDSGDVAAAKREFAAQMQQVGTRLTALETENKNLKTEKKNRDHEDLVRDLLRGDHIAPAQKTQVVEMAQAVGVDKAREFFTQFKAGLQGSKSLNLDADGVTDAKTPEQAIKALDGQVVKMVKELNLKEGEAMARVYGAAENNLLVALANSTSRPR